MADKMLKPSPDLMVHVRQAFLDYGYAGLSMVDLAKACSFTRRSLYNYFNSKDDAFKASITYENAGHVRRGLEAGERVRREGGSALDIFSEIMDVRYGFTRRMLNQSPHTVELNAEAFKRCRDSMITSAIEFQDALAKLLVDLEKDGLLRLTREIHPYRAAQMLADGGRAVNQSLPPPTSEDLAGRYREMCQAVLYGCAVPVKTGRRVPPKASPRTTAKPAKWH
jgi:AcrR family transcriptional regulator